VAIFGSRRTIENLLNEIDDCIAARAQLLDNLKFVRRLSVGRVWEERCLAV